MSFAGKLSDMDVADLVQTLELGRKSGALHMKSALGLEAVCYFRDGRIVDCELGTFSGEDAFYRLLEWREGDFAMEFTSVDREQRIAVSTQGLLLEGLRRIDEGLRTDEQLPLPGTASVEAHRPAPAAPEDAAARAHGTSRESVEPVPRHGPCTARAYLVVLAGSQFGELFRLEPGRDVEIGRRPESEVFVQDPGVSRHHATIRVDERGATVRDLGSRNGTFVNGYARPEARVGDGGRIQIGASTTLRFAMSDATEAEFQRRIADSALHDPLTGLHNRMILSERIAATVTAYRLKDKPLALLALDIDFFKKVNDQHGHIAGDEVLKTVAAVVKRAVRADDLVARWGGEEFMVLAPDTGLTGARALAEKIRAAAAAATTAWRGAELTVTVSVGIAALSTARQLAPETAERVLVEAADRALYLAKKCGRNRVEAQEVGC